MPVVPGLVRSQVAAVSARSWARVRVSLGFWRARAAAVVRSQIPAAVPAGRYAESQAMPSRSGVYSIRRSAALLLWRSSMPAGWWRSRQLRALARNRDATRSPAGQPRAGPGAPGSRKCASRAAAPAGSRPVVSSTMIRACCQEIDPAPRAFRVSGSAVVRARLSARSAAEARSLTVRTQASSATRAISWAARSCADAAGGAKALAARA